MMSKRISFTCYLDDAKVRFSDLEYFGYSKMLESKDFINIDTVKCGKRRMEGVIKTDSIVA